VRMQHRLRYSPIVSLLPEIQLAEEVGDTTHRRALTLRPQDRIRGPDWPIIVNGVCAKFQLFRWGVRLCAIVRSLAL
jgi:hypothetical protein